MLYAEALLEGIKERKVGAVCLDVKGYIGRFYLVRTFCKGATYYGIAMSVRRICEAIVRDEKSILPVSSIQRGDSEIKGLALSMPMIVGKNGVEGAVPIELSDHEREELKKSADTLQSVINDVF